MPKLLVLPDTPSIWLRMRVAVLLVYILLASIYAAVTPIFEISDEVSHYPVVDYIARTGELPVQDPDRPNAWDWEAAQPPLYYVLSAIIVVPFDRSDLYEDAWVINPHTQVGIQDTTHNRNLMGHNWDAHTLPWRGSQLHVRLVRAFSILLSAGAVWLIFTIGRQVSPQAPSIALLMMGLTAFNPMFIAIGSSVNNDNLATFFVTLSLAMSFTIWHEGFTWPRVIALALVCTLAAAAKLSGSYAFIIAGLAIALTVYRQRLPFRVLVLAGIVFVLMWGVLMGWWYIRNWQLYDDFFGNRHMAETVGLREPSISVFELIREEWFSFYVAYWGAFGALTFLAPASLFFYTGMLIVLAVIGGLLSIRRISLVTKHWQDGVPLGLLALLLILGLAGVISWSLLTPASQGRLLFPYNAAIVALLSIGLHHMLQPRLARLTLLPLAVFAVYSGTITIPLAFALPPTVEQSPSDAQFVDVRFDEVELLAVNIDDAVITPDDPQLTMTLYWQTTQTEQPLSYFVEVYGRNINGDLVLLGKRDSYPGGGLLSTRFWEEGVIYEDELTLVLDQWPDTGLILPFQPRIRVGMRNADADLVVQAVNAANEPIDTVVVNGGRAIGSDEPQSEDVSAEFVDLAYLYDVTLRQEGEQLVVDVLWEPQQQALQDLTVYVHLIPPDNPQGVIATGDAPPRDGWYPTSAWVADYGFIDQYRISLEDVPSGTYELLIGFYDPNTFIRVPVVDGKYPDAFVATIDIE